MTSFWLIPLDHGRNHRNSLPRRTWLLGGWSVDDSLSGHKMKSEQDGVTSVTSSADRKEERQGIRDASQKGGRHHERSFYLSVKIIFYHLCSLPLHA